MRVAILGGTGKFGRALARRLHAAGDDVVLGSRDADRAGAVAAELGVRGATNSEAVRDVDVIVLAVDADAVVETARALAPAIGSTPVVCVASNLRAQTPSLAEQVADVVDAPVAAGFHTVAARAIDDEQDVLVCGDDGAKQLGLELARRVGRGLDAGPLSAAAALEALTGILLTLNRNYKAHSGVRITGL